MPHNRQFRHVIPCTNKKLIHQRLSKVATHKQIQFTKKNKINLRIVYFIIDELIQVVLYDFDAFVVDLSIYLKNLLNIEID